MKQIFGVIVSSVGIAALLAFGGYSFWQEEVVPGRDFVKYFNMTPPKDSVARQAATPTVIDRLFKLHDQLPEQELADLNKQIDETQTRMNESQEERDRYFRLLGHRDELIKKSQPLYDQFEAACSSGAALLEVHTIDRFTYPGNLFLEVGCPIYPSGF